MATKIEGISGLKAAVGTHLGYSDWLEVTQEQVDLFAEATGDHQWIHVDTERAKAGPFGTTIAHGFLTLSLFPKVMADVVSVEGISMGINYGLDKVRFISPVKVGSKIRIGIELTGVEDVDRGVQVSMTVTYEMEGSAKPACVAHTLTRFYP